MKNPNPILSQCCGAETTTRDSFSRLCKKCFMSCNRISKDQIYCSHTDGTTTHKIEDCPFQPTEKECEHNNSHDMTETFCMDCDKSVEDIFKGKTCECKNCMQISIKDRCEKDCTDIDCKPLPPESSNWMEEEREVFYENEYLCSANSSNQEIADYWLSRMAEKIEEAYEKGIREGIEKTLEDMPIFKEKARQEERERIVKMIEEMIQDTPASNYEENDFNAGKVKSLVELLANLNSNE